MARPGPYRAFMQTGCTRRLRLKRHFTILCVPGPTLGQYKLQAGAVAFVHPGCTTRERSAKQLCLVTQTETRV
jgi:hypothetical protein